MCDVDQIYFMWFPPFSMGLKVSLKLDKKIGILFSNYKQSYENIDIWYQQLKENPTALHTSLH